MKKYPYVRLDLVACHKALWLWLAKNPNRSKDHWQGWRTIERLLRQQLFKDKRIKEVQYSLHRSCFACPLTLPENCRGCPIAINMGGACGESSSAYYQLKWKSDGNPKKQLKCIRKIANAWDMTKRFKTLKTDGGLRHEIN